MSEEVKTTQDKKEEIKHENCIFVDLYESEMEIKKRAMNKRLRIKKELLTQKLFERLMMK